MKNEITITRTEGNWTFGKLGEYRFEVKHYREPSEEYGLDFDGRCGRISKLSVERAYSYTTVCHYDRGWDVLPRSDADQDACAAIIRRFN